VTVIQPGATTRPATNQTIVVTDGIIRMVGPAKTTPIPSGARRIAAAGKFVIPGLWDRQNRWKTLPQVPNRDLVTPISRLGRDSGLAS